MERLTERITTYLACDKIGNLTQITYIGIKDKKLAEEKLCLLEDIEEELGIDLITLFKALKNGVWYYDDSGQLLHDYVWLVNNYLTSGASNKLSFSFRTFLRKKILLFKDYGKTWALTKEELL